MALASLILGILSICNKAPFVTGVLGIVFAAKTIKNPSTHKIAKGGLVCSIIGLALIIVRFIIIMVLILFVGLALSECEFLMPYLMEF